MKYIIILMLTAVICLFPALPPAAGADGTPSSREVSVYLYSDCPDCIFFISWSNAGQSASIYLESPYGEIIYADEANTQFSAGSAAVYIEMAQRGNWIVHLAGENLGTVNISGGSMFSPSESYNAIRSFNAAAADGNAEFTWDVESDSRDINITVSASQGGRDIRSVWRNTSAAPSGSEKIAIENQLTTGIYFFTLQVSDWFRQYSLSIDTPVYVTQKNAPGKLSNVTTGSVDGEMYATWLPDISSQLYSVTLYDYATLSVIKTERIYNNYYVIDPPDGIDILGFSVAAIDENYIHGEFDIFEIRQSIPRGTVTFPGSTVTRESVVSIRFDCPDNEKAGIYLNGTLLLEDTDAGEYDLTLSEGTHDILAYIKDANGNMKTFPKSITIDKTPPALRLNIEDSISVTTDSIVLEGISEPGAVVAVNGIEQELENGSFMVKLALQKGVNLINVSAYDSAGNKNVASVTVERTGQISGGWTVFILPGIIFILLSGWYVYLTLKEKRLVTE